MSLPHAPIRDSARSEAPRVLVTGASGYVGGRLVPRLLEAGYRVRCMARSPGKLGHRPWSGHERLEVVQGDADDPEELSSALHDCTYAFYLIHAMMLAGPGYSELDRRQARNFAIAAHERGVARIVYLGGLGETGTGLSRHLESRREVEALLGSTGVPLTVLRAAMIIGSGSASFEILRYLVERLPVMITPRWVDTRCQPVAIRDVLNDLMGCLANPATAGRTLDIGGPEVLTYRELMVIMAEERGLPRRWILPVPILTPRLSSLWIHLVTPISSRMARPLAEGLRNEVICRSDEARTLLPGERLPVRDAIRRALENLRASRVETAWTDAGPMPGDPDWSGGSVFSDRWQVDVEASPEEVFRAVCRIGGGHGWYAADWLWRLRGALDRVVGGPGLRRGRRDRDEVRYGEALDFWRVTEVEAPRRLALRAEMKLPGLAQLAFDLEPLPDGRTHLLQSARFVPHGLLGLLYWYAVVPLHRLVFRGMLNGIREGAEQLSGRRPAVPSPVVRASPPPLGGGR